MVPRLPRTAAAPARRPPARQSLGGRYNDCMASKKRPADLTLEVLKDIRDDVRKTNDEVRKTNVRLDELRSETRAGFAFVSQRFEEVSQRFEDVGRRIVDSEIRTATAITDLGETLHEVRDELRASLDLRPRVEHCEREIAEIKSRIDPR